MAEEDAKMTEMSGVVDLGGGTSGPESEREVEAIRARCKEMEVEAEKLKQMQEEVDRQLNPDKPNHHQTLTPEEKAEIDMRSIYVGNVDYSTTADELERHFHGCGAVNRVTILTDKYSGHPKGFAYVEFTEKDSVQIAIALDESSFKGRIIKVNPKRTNKPGISTTNRPPPGRGGYGGYRGRGRGGFGAMRGRGGFRGRGRWTYTPY